MSYYKTSIEYHDALDRREAHERAERAEREYEAAEQEKFVGEILQKPDELYGPGWEADADKLRSILEEEEIRETLAIFGPAHLTPNLQIVESVQPVFHATREWTKRHLNVEDNGFEGALDKAFGSGKWTLT